jgi:hypothetical protein
LKPVATYFCPRLFSTIRKRGQVTVGLKNKTRLRHKTVQTGTNWTKRHKLFGGGEAFLPPFHCLLSTPVGRIRAPSRTDRGPQHWRHICPHRCCGLILLPVAIANAVATVAFGRCPAPSRHHRYRLVDCCCRRHIRCRRRCWGLGCQFLQESSRFLFFPFRWHFFHRNQDSCSAVTFFLPPQESCLYRAYIRSRRKLRRT